MIALQILLWVAVVCVSAALICATILFIRGMLRGLKDPRDKK